MTEPDRRSPACALVIFGASGDLTARKLLPALERLAALRGAAGGGGAGRGRPHAHDRRGVRAATAARRWPARTTRAGPTWRPAPGTCTAATTTRPLTPGWPRCWTSATGGTGTAGSRVYYFATPPRLFGPIALSLGKAGLSVPDGDAFVRAVIEKPFGWDEASARELYADLSTAFVEEQIFRIDHYLAKETVQNLLALRFANSIFEPIWNRTWVDNVQITVAETLGVGDRGGFYETTGAMRDIVQNHVLQVLSLFLMEPPTSFHPEAIRDEKVKLLRAIRPLDDEAEIAAHAVRGQYTRGGTRERPDARVPGGARRRPAQLDRDVRGHAPEHPELAVDRRPRLRAHRQAAARRGSPRWPCSSAARRSCRCSPAPTRTWSPTR